MSAPLHDPLVVNTQDGCCWTRRAVNREGRGLYALADVQGPVPELVLATLRELAEHGLSSMAFALPMPVGGVPQLSEVEQLRARIAELEAERHVTNEALDDAVQELREREKQAAVVAEFVAARAEYITAIRNCHPDNGHDYDRWQGHAAARRQLAELLGLPVAWPPGDKPKPVVKPEGEHYPYVHRSYLVSHDRPELGGV